MDSEMDKCDDGDMNEDRLTWSTIASIIYFSLYLTLVSVISIHQYLKGEHENKKSLVKAVWKQRGIYGQLLVHLYDTATDVGVLVEWYILMEREQNGCNIESLDMTILFWTSISFLILYRLLSVIFGCSGGYQDHWSSADDKYIYGMMCFDGCLGLLDMYVLKAVWQAISDEKEETTMRQKMIQLTESVFESLPQVVLQSVFIIRASNDPYLQKNNSSLYLVGMSLCASLFSISSKYIMVDQGGVIEEAAEAKISKKCNFIQKFYVLRVIWRFSYVTTRFVILSLVWSVLGGAFLPIFMAISWIEWSIIFIWICFQEDWSIGYALLIGPLYGMLCLVASPPHSSKILAIAHALEMIVMMVIINIFSFSSFDCSICANPHDRQATNNQYILSFVIVGWISMLIDFITYFFMLYFKLFNDDGFDALWKVYGDGMQP